MYGNIQQRRWGSIIPLTARECFISKKTFLQVFQTLIRDVSCWDLRKRRKLQRLVKKFLRKLRYLIPPHQTTLTVIKQRSGLRSNLDGESLGKFFRDEKRFLRSSYKSYISPSYISYWHILEICLKGYTQITLLACKGKFQAKHSLMMTLIEGMM